MLVKPEPTHMVIPLARLKCLSEKSWLEIADQAGCESAKILAVIPQIPILHTVADFSRKPPGGIAHWSRLAPLVDYRVNGKFVGKVLEQDLAKEPLAHFDGTRASIRTTKFARNFSYVLVFRSAVLH
jgi:hypothetical protein